MCIFSRNNKKFNNGAISITATVTPQTDHKSPSQEQETNAKFREITLNNKPDRQRLKKNDELKRSLTRFRFSKPNNNGTKP